LRGALRVGHGLDGGALASTRGFRVVDLLKRLTHTISTGNGHTMGVGFEGDYVTWDNLVRLQRAFGFKCRQVFVKSTIETEFIFFDEI
jgi:hypothetical protein